MPLRSLSDIAKTSRARYIVASLVAISLFGGHLWFTSKTFEAHSEAFRQESNLLDKVFKEAGVSWGLSSQALELTDQVPSGPAYAEAHRRRIQLDNRISWVLLSLIIWPVFFLITAFWAAHRFWQGKGLKPEQLQLRRDRALLRSTVALGLLFALLVVLWRLMMSATFYERRYSLAPVTNGLVMCFLVGLLAVVFIRLFWSLMSSSVSRLRWNLNSVSPIYRVSIQAAVVSVIAFLTSNDLENFKNYEYVVPSSAALSVQAIAWVGAITALGSAMLGYLRTSNSGREVVATSAQSPITITDNMDGTAVLDALSSRLSGVSDKVDQLTSLIQLNDHRKLKSKKAHSQISDDIIRERGERIRQRLLTEVHSLTRRGNVNLMIGSVTSLIAAIILWMLVAQAPLGTLGPSALTGYYLPRISVAIFIEIFSFFFLRLYKNGLSDIMYYQNELTNLDSRMLALEIGSLLPSHDALLLILKDLSSTDRNFVLKAGESTVELEKVKEDQQQIQSLLTSLASKISDLKTTLSK